VEVSNILVALVVVFRKESFQISNLLSPGGDVIFGVSDFVTESGDFSI